MGRKGVAKLVNRNNGKVYIFSSARDIYRYADEVETKLINGWHSNTELQQDYYNNPHAFKIEILYICDSDGELNRLQADEIDKYWPNGYNKRRGNISYEGGNNNPFRKSENNENFIMTGFMERLFDILNESNLPQEGKDFLEDIIDEGFVTSEYDLIRAIRDMERLLDILNKSKLKSKDKKDLKEKIMNGTIFSEDDLKTEIENILKTYKSKSKNKKSSNKNSSSRNKNKKPKKHTWEEYDKTHNTKAKKTFQEKLNDDLKTEKRYGGSQYKNYPKHKRKFNISKNIKNFAIILCVLFIGASAAMFLVGHLLPPSSASFDDEVVVDIGGDGMLIAQLEDSLIINEENISDGLFNTAQITNLPWIDAKNISYVDYAGIKGYMIVWKTSIDHYSVFDNKNVVNYLSGPVEGLSANCFVAYSPETDSVYGIILSNHNEYDMEGDLLYKVLNLNSKDFKLSYGHDSDLFYT